LQNDFWEEAMTRPYVTALLTTCAALAFAGTVHAGGFSRGNADTDILFEEGNFNMRTGMTFVAPKRRFATLTAPPGAALGGLQPGQSYKGTDEDYTQSYVIPSAAVKFNITEDLRCAGSYTQPFGADSEYGEQAIAFGGWADGTGTTAESFITNEFAATCAYKFDLAKGRAWLIGGGFLQDFKYSQTVQFNGDILALGLAPIIGAPAATYYGAALNGTDASLKFDGGYEPGFRIGAAYEIPEIALRAQIMYRSEVTHTPDGTFTTALDGVTPPFPNAPPFTSGLASGVGTLPQSVELKLQSGIAPGWLAFGSVKWTDWSVLDKLDYTISGGPLPGARELEYYFRDGWTVSAGLGHAFTEEISGVMGLTWDRGTSTTEDTLSDTYTLAAGLALKDKLGGEVRFGGAISYLTAASVSAESGQTVGEYDPGASFGYSVDGDWTYAGSLGYKINW